MTVIDNPHEIRPFRTKMGSWIFSDHSRKIRHEGLVGGTDLILDKWAETVPHGTFGLRLQFASEPFDGYKWTGRREPDPPVRRLWTPGDTDTKGLELDAMWDVYDDWQNFREDYACWFGHFPETRLPPQGLTHHARELVKATHEDAAELDARSPGVPDALPTSPEAGVVVAGGAGSWYTWEQASPPMTGYLCPVLLRYFDTPPDVLYIAVKPLSALAGSLNRLLA
jgi:hypothetical protein